MTKKKLIEEIKEMENKMQKIAKPKTTPQTKKKPKAKTKKIKSFDDYFQECIKNKSIPKDTPKYLRKALERTMKEYEQRTVLEKSALKNFAEKYVIEGKPGILPKQFFQEKARQIKQFFRNNRNIKVKMVLVCILKHQKQEKRLTYITQDKGYFHSKTYINIKSTKEKKIIPKMFVEILEGIRNYQINGSGWYFKEVVQLEIHKVDYKPMKGSSYISLPDFIKAKRAVINIGNRRDNKCFK